MFFQVDTAASIRLVYLEVRLAFWSRFKYRLKPCILTYRCGMCADEFKPDSEEEEEAESEDDEDDSDVDEDEDEDEDEEEYSEEDEEEEGMSWEELEREAIR